MEVSVREIIRSIKNDMNVKFDMLEQIISLSSSVPTPTATPITTTTTTTSAYNELYELVNQQTDEIDSIKSMMYRLNDVILNMQKKIDSMEVSDHMPELHITQPSEVEEKHFEYPYEEVKVEKEQEEVEEEEEAEEEQEEAEEEEAEEEAEEEQEEEQEEAEEAEEAEQEQEEEEEAEEAEQEEGVELEEFEYKGMTLYRDTENKVYRMDEDGALSDPLGIWDEVKQRIKKL